MNHLSQIVRVETIRGFKEGQRVTAQDVEVSPPQLHRGRVHSVWSDATAMIVWDTLDQQRDRHLSVNGRVDLHHLSRDLAS